MRHTLIGRHWLAACAVVPLATPASSQPPSQLSPARAEVGRIVGTIDGVSQTDGRTYLAGWACQRGQDRSIAVHIYADTAASDPSRTTLVVAGQADRPSEPGINQACQDHEGSRHRFLIELPVQFVEQSSDARLYVHGIRIADGVPNDAIAKSGARLKNLPGFAAHLAWPAMSGSYHSLADHPRVFTTPSELAELASRINHPGSYSSQRFAQLISQIAHDIAAPNDWHATYAGCDLTPYTYAFSYEPQDADTAAKLHSAFRLGPTVTPPAGAAVVAARLALYAALAKAGAALPVGAPNTDQATALAKRILLAWSDRGFRDSHGAYLSTPAQFCDATGKANEATAAGVGLAVSRGVIYSAHAQDLLLYSGAITPDEVKRLDAFHTAMYELIRNALNDTFAGHHAWVCDHYSNHAANQLAGLLATARLLDDKPRFDAALSGVDPSVSITLPWISFFDRAIYGDGDSPNACYPNSGPDGLTSRPFFQTATVSAGEIDDRYRNASPAQGVGYPMFTLERLFDTAEILRIAGYDPYGYRGRHRQSIEMATSYYACLAKAAGFANTFTAEHAAACPDAAQYLGKTVNGVDSNAVFGAYRFPSNADVTGVENAAKRSASAGAFSLDTIFFGRWRD